MLTQHRSYWPIKTFKSSFNGLVFMNSDSKTQLLLINQHQKRHRLYI